MKKTIFKNDNIEFFEETTTSVFLCSYCKEMANENPVRSIDSKKQMKVYHQECAQAEIQKLNKTVQTQILTAIGSKFKSADNVSSLSEKKNRLKQLLADEDLSSISPELDVVEKVIEEVKKPIAKIEYKDPYITISHSYDEELIRKYHRINQVKWNNGFKYWECNLEKADFETTRFLLKIYKENAQYEWLISEPAYKKITERKNHFEAKMKVSRELKELKLKDDIDIDLSHMKKQPYPYQKVAVAFLDKINGVGMVGDDMRLGKTITSLAYISLKKFHTLVITPSVAKRNWKKETIEFTHSSVEILTDFAPEDLNPKNPLADILIINYEQIEKYEKYLKKAKFDCVILDESHYIRNLQAKRTKLIFKLLKKIPHRICLSGTPIKNKPIEFYSQLKFLKPDLFSNKLQYALRYCDAKENEYGWDYSGASNLEELGRMISTFYIRRLRQEVSKELPKTNITVTEVDLNVTERNEYIRQIRSFQDLVEYDLDQYGTDVKKRKVIGIHLGKMMQLKEFCSLAKVSRVIEFVKDFIASSNDKVVIFSGFIDTQKKLKETFGDQCVSILGSDSDIKKDDAVTKFREDPTKRIFVGSLLSAGVAIDLASANTVVFADLPWSEADLAQAFDRIQGPKQKSANLFAYYFVFKNTIEEDIWSLIGSKLEITKELLKTDRYQKEDDVVREVFKKYVDKFNSRQRNKNIV